MTKYPRSRASAILIMVLSLIFQCGHLCKANEPEAAKGESNTPAPQTAPSAEQVEAHGNGNVATISQILAAVETAEQEIQDMKARVTITRTVVLLEEKEVSSGRLMYKKQGKIRLEISKPQRKTTVINGDVIYLHEPEIKQVQKIVVDEERRRGGDPLRYGFIRSVAEVKRLYNIKLVETERQGDETFYVLELKPKAAEASSEYTKVMLWIEAERWIPVKMKQFEGEDEIETLYELRDVKLNTNISDRVFEFKIPKGRQVIEH